MAGSIASSPVATTPISGGGGASIPTTGLDSLPGSYTLSGTAKFKRAITFKIATGTYIETSHAYLGSVLVVPLSIECSAELSKPTRFIPEIADIFIVSEQSQIPSNVMPMRVRKLDSDGDMRFGRGQNDFWRNVPEAPAQCVYTRLVFWKGEWFLDPSDGTDWNTKVLGKYTEQTRDPLVIMRTSQTKGVDEVLNYSSAVDRNTRQFSASININTIYGQAQIQGPI